MSGEGIKKKRQYIMGRSNLNKQGTGSGGFELSVFVIEMEEMTILLVWEATWKVGVESASTPRTQRWFNGSTQNLENYSFYCLTYLYCYFFFVNYCY